MSSHYPPPSELPPERTTLALLELTGGDYSHLQHVIQAHPVAHAESAGGPHGAFPLTSAQAIDLSTSGEDHCQVQPEVTPLSHSVVPDFVLARITNEENSSVPTGSASNLKKSNLSARVCLEKRFNILSVDHTTQQDVQSAVLSSVLSRLQQIAEPQNAVLHPEKQTDDTAETCCVSNSQVMRVYDPEQNIYSQVVALVEPGQHQNVILPKNFTVTFQPERVVPKSINAAQKDEAMLAASRGYYALHCSDTAKAAKGGSSSTRWAQRKVVKETRRLSNSERKERHNSLERERRRKIRLCCNELNTLVPFCKASTDKLTTLQWAVSFLRYLCEAYGDRLKEEFLAFSHRKSSSSPGLSLILGEEDDTHSIHLGVEQ